MNSWVDILFSSIARQEGDFSGRQVIPVLYNNPLDLRYAGQLNATRPDGPAGPPNPDPEPIAVFSSLEAGIAAGYRQLWLWIALGLTLRELLLREAPAGPGNDPAVYLANVQEWTGISDADAPLMGYLRLQPPPKT
jgi:hypothetical protein